jgi:predicted DCC family thiol-disulfide oxidoreductase YuxK
MDNSRLQAQSCAEGSHLLLYDGHCGLCSHLVRFVLSRDHEGLFHFASLQSPTGIAAVGDSGCEDLTTFYVIANYRTPQATPFTKGGAALFVAHSLGWPWKSAGLFGVLPMVVLDRIYNLVARNRYGVFGRHEHCLIPLPQYRNRFIDS